jgi:hypothetical protein
MKHHYATLFIAAVLAAAACSSAPAAAAPEGQQVIPVWGEGVAPGSEGRATGAAAELHIYAKGAHRFGTTKQGLPVDHWLDAFQAWLGQQGFVPNTPGSDLRTGT